MKQSRLYCIGAALAASSVLAITPKQMLAANRYSDAQPNPSGDFAIFTATNYSFATKKTSAVWNHLDLKTGAIKLWHSGSGISEVVFIDKTNILYLNDSNAEDDGGVSLYHAEATNLGAATLVATLSAPFSGLKAAKTTSGDIHFLLSAQAYPNGTAYNEQTAETPASTARIYDTLFVRHWDHYLTPYKNAVFGGILRHSSPGNGTAYPTNVTAASAYTFDGSFTNYVTGICNLTCAESPLDNNGAGDYTLSPDGSLVAFRTKDIELPIANYTSSQIYLVPFGGTAGDAVVVNPRTGNAIENERGSIDVKYPEAQGATASPVFSPDSQKIAYVQQNGINYESDRWILYVADVKTDINNKETAENQPAEFKITRLAGDWDRSAESPVWSRNSQTIVVAAEDRGRTRLFEIPVSAGDGFVPRNITDEGSVANFYIVPSTGDGNSGGDVALVSDSKLWSSRDIYSVPLSSNSAGTSDPAAGTSNARVYFRANEVDLELAGLGPDDVSEFYYKTNTSEIEQQAWVVYPAGFDRTKKYPLAFITHGGPQGSNANSWSTRWNFKVWADQGYVVVAPNPTASTGFGQNLTDAVQGRWGTHPYWDIVHAWRYVNESLDFVDTGRGIHAGASFGGYMSNWVQGHEMGRWFRAIVTHDGSTSTLNQYASEELWFMDHDFGGAFVPPKDMRPGSPYYDHDPLLYVDQWATPHFVVHNDLDYRLPVSEGILLFNLLQTRGVPSRFLSFPDENHWVVKRENSLVWHTEIFKWINYYSGISGADSPY